MKINWILFGFNSVCVAVRRKTKHFHSWKLFVAFTSLSLSTSERGKIEFDIYVIAIIKHFPESFFHSVLISLNLLESIKESTSNTHFNTALTNQNFINIFQLHVPSSKCDAVAKKFTENCIWWRRFPWQVDRVWWCIVCYCHHWLSYRHCYIIVSFNREAAGVGWE